MTDSSSRHPYGSRIAGPARLSAEQIVNHPEQHAFVMLGSKELFLCHLTMYHMEEHAYQFVVMARLADEAMEAFRVLRSENRYQTFFVGNREDDLMTVPDLQSGARRYFIGDVFLGLPNKPHYEDWPWRSEMPVISKVPVKIERVVYYRHFASSFQHPERLTYVLFGFGDEAHMTNCQTKEPDFDHIVSLAEAPEWLPPRQLESGVHVTVDDSESVPLCTNPLPRPTSADPAPECMVRYRGEGKQLPVRIGAQYWFCTKVANETDPCPKEATNPCDRP